MHNREGTWKFRVTVIFPNRPPKTIQGSVTLRGPQIPEQVAMQAIEQWARQTGYRGPASLGPWSVQQPS